MAPFRALDDLGSMFLEHRQRVVVDDGPHVGAEPRRIAQHQVIHAAG